MNFTKLKQIFSDQGCKRIYIKELSPNDNSKNQVYLGGSFDILNIFPISEITSDNSGDWEKVRFKATVKFKWIISEGRTSSAPKAQLILYPKYPEVRFSGFLAGCEEPPSDLMNSRLQGRILFLSATTQGDLVGFVCSADSDVANGYYALKDLTKHGIFSIVDLEGYSDGKMQLMKELARIHSYNWINSKRLNSERLILPCNAPNCGGYTLEAELGITPNGYSEPDFMGWEIKQYSATRFDKIGSTAITLFTPEPTGGFYKEKGVDSFIRKYGYPDKGGIEDRLNFGGVHKDGEIHPLTGLKLILLGYDYNLGKIRNPDGGIALLDRKDVVTALWSFNSLLKHWNRKHNQACYVPSQNQREPRLQYRYGNLVMLNTGTDFSLFLKAMERKDIYYDPGIKIENASGKSKIKRRNQFRIKVSKVKSLYFNSNIINVCS